MIGLCLLAIVTDNGAGGETHRPQDLRTPWHQNVCTAASFELGVKNVFQDLRSMITVIRDVVDFVRCSTVRVIALKTPFVNLRSDNDSR